MAKQKDYTKIFVPCSGCGNPNVIDVPKNNKEAKKIRYLRVCDLCKSSSAYKYDGKQFKEDEVSWNEKLETHLNRD